MTYQEEEQTRLHRQTSRQAITLAMQGKWREAISLNENLIESFPDDVDAFNRLGRAYMELGDYHAAKSAYESALKVDPYNNIARKNLTRLSHLGNTAPRDGDGFHAVEAQQFIEEVGKAGVVNLRTLAPSDVLAKMVAGNKVNLKVLGTGLRVETTHGEYLGMVDPRHAQRLVRLMEGGNKYSAAIVNAAEEGVTVIIRETFQDPSQAGRLSFPPKGGENYRPYVGDRIIRRGLEFEENAAEDSGYNIITGEGEETTEILAESNDMEEEEEEVDDNDE